MKQFEGKPMTKEQKQLIAVDLEMIINTATNAGLDGSAFETIRLSVNHIIETMQETMQVT